MAIIGHPGTAESPGYELMGYIHPDTGEYMLFKVITEYSTHGPWEGFQDLLPNIEQIPSDRDALRPE